MIAAFVNKSFFNSQTMLVPITAWITAYIAFHFQYPHYVLPYIVITFLVCTALIISYTTMGTIFFINVITLAYTTELSIGAAAMRLPSEPIMIVIALAFIIKCIRQPSLLHIITSTDSLLVGALLLCHTFATLYSTMFVVSLKAMALKLLYITNFYFVVKYLIRHSPIVFEKWIQVMLFATVPLVWFIIYRHSAYGFSKTAAATVVEPFFSDHTIYSCFLTFLLIYSIYFFRNNNLATSMIAKIAYTISSCTLLLGIILSGCRAAGLSLIAAGLLYIIFIFDIRKIYLLFLIVVAIIYGAVHYDDFIIAGKRNRNDSSATTADIVTQAQSVTNLSSDKSNLERLNRWSCAWRMFIDKPLFGFGPGTYQFQYLDYQLKSEMTTISVTSPYNIRKGHGGTAHNEYLLQLSESGCFSLALFLCFMVFTLRRSFANHSVNSLLLAAGVAVCTYLIHGCFNNFLDTDKTAFLFYASLAYIHCSYYPND